MLRSVPLLGAVRNPKEAASALLSTCEQGLFELKEGWVKFCIGLQMCFVYTLNATYVDFILSFDKNFIAKESHCAARPTCAC